MPKSEAGSVALTLQAGRVCCSVMLLRPVAVLPRAERTGSEKTEVSSILRLQLRLSVSPGRLTA